MSWQNANLSAVFYFYLMEIKSLSRSFKIAYVCIVLFFSQAFNFTWVSVFYCQMSSLCMTMTYYNQHEINILNDTRGMTTWGRSRLADSPR